MSSAMTDALRPGLPYPLGATWTGDGVNFAVFSAHASRIDLCIFDDDGSHEIARLELPELTDQVWHGFLPGARPGLVYGYRAHGPYVPAEGHRFNPHKLLLDPYAVELVGRLKWEPPLFAYDLQAKKAGQGYDKRDSAPFMPKARVPALADLPRLQRGGPRVPWERMVIYEAHVRGLTRLHPDVPGPLRGTIAGLACSEIIDHLKALGVTSVELLPVYAYVGDAVLTDRGLRNYWGYNTLAFFALEPTYVSGGGASEFREMVSRMHDAGLEVILDVAYNHTAEGNELGPTLSFKGLDNASYYRLNPQDRSQYINDTGTGNTVNLTHPRVLQLVADSLRHWVTQTGIDGFRFDLATILGREDGGFDPGCGFLDVCRQDPVLGRVKLIAEPWDVGPGGYQCGNFPPGWAEWNDAFRDTVRAFWRGDEGQAGELATRLAGSADRFNRNGRRPWASVNFITAHDGFTLNDLVSYNEKHNQANGEGNRDGHDDNRSWNCGVEGPTHDPKINELRERQKRNLVATLLLSQGTPMVLAGDEVAHTQRGNNNAYCQDNEISWINWPCVDASGERLYAFVRQLTAIRRTLPVLRPARFATGGDPTSNMRDVVWLAPDGTELQSDSWKDPQLRAFAMLADGRAHLGSGREPGADAVVLLAVNASDRSVEWTMPTALRVERWVRLVDTELAENDVFLSLPVGQRYTAGPRSLLLFVAAPDAVTAECVHRLLGELAVARVRER